mgnify:FL=1
MSRRTLSCDSYARMAGFIISDGTRSLAFSLEASSTSPGNGRVSLPASAVQLSLTDSVQGADVFDQYLVDWDPALNAGNWYLISPAVASHDVTNLAGRRMWLSASAFFHQYYRVYSPATYGQKSDSSGALIRHFCPELKDLPDKFIYEPWKAPTATLAKAGVTLGVNYPEVSCSFISLVRS